MRFALSFVTCIAAVAAAPTANLVVRKPSDESGNTKIDFHTETETLPTTLESSAAFFQDSITLTDSSGAVIKGSCTTPGKDQLLNLCTFSSDKLQWDITVTASWYAPGAPQISFTYLGYDYDTTKKEPYCGHTKDAYAFGGTQDAVCYFNA